MPEETTHLFRPSALTPVAPSPSRWDSAGVPSQLKVSRNTPSNPPQDRCGSDRRVHPARSASRSSKTAQKPLIFLFIPRIRKNRELPRCTPDPWGVLSKDISPYTNLEFHVRCAAVTANFFPSRRSVQNASPAFLAEKKFAEPPPLLLGGNLSHRATTSISLAGLELLLQFVFFSFSLCSSVIPSFPRETFAFAACAKPASFGHIREYFALTFAPEKN